MILVHDFLSNSAQNSPDRPAILCGDRSITFGDLDRASDRVACALQDSGVRRGDRVAVFMENSIELVVSVFGILKAGAVFVIINSTTKTNKLAHMLGDCGVQAALVRSSLAAVVAPIRDSVPSLRTLVWTDACPQQRAAELVLTNILAAPHVRPRDPGLIDEDLCTIIYTTGSTGDPKGVMLTHRNMTNTAWAISTYLENRPDDVVVCVLPLSFDYGLYQVITGARVGFTVLLEKSFAFPYHTLQRMAACRVTGLPGVPTIFATILQLAPYDGLDLSALRYFSNTAAAFPPAHIRRLQQLFPQVRIYSMYGLTECTRVSYLPPERLHDKIGSVGRAMPNSEVFIVDDGGRRVGPGVVGELVVRGANVMRGYWGRPVETAQRLREGECVGEKLLYSGDYFRMDEEGFLYFVGRKDDIFKCKGEKISPKEIENVLYEIPAVAEAAVIGVEDPLDGHAIKAIVVPREGCALTEQDIRRHCRANLENYMVPKFVEISGALPKTESGKIRKRVLS